LKFPVLAGCAGRLAGPAKCEACAIFRHIRSTQHIRSSSAIPALTVIGATDSGDWTLPQEFITLRRLLEARIGKKGKREFVQVLRLMEVFKIDDVAGGVRDAIDCGAVGFDAVKHLVLCRIERRPPRLNLTVYPYLPKAVVATTSARSYMGRYG